MSRVAVTLVPGTISEIPINPPIPSSCIRDSIILSMLLILTELSSYLLTIFLLMSSEVSIQLVIVSTIPDTCSILETSCLLEDSTSLMAVSIISICCFNSPESSVILLTLIPVCVTLSSVTCMSCNSCSIEAVILSEMVCNRASASRI